MLNMRKKPRKTTLEMSELEKRYQDIIVTIKKAAAKKEKELHDTRNDANNTAAAAEAESTLVENVAQETEGKSKKRSSKDDSERNTAAASEAGSTIVDTVAHETENGSKKRSSKHDEQRSTAAALEAECTLVDTVMHETEGSTTMRSSEADNPRGGFAHLEHRRPDGWTSTPRGKDEEKNCGKHVDTSSHSLVRTGGEEDAHDNISNILAAAGAATRGQGSDCRNNAHSVTNILNAVQKNILLHESFLGSERQVLSCYNSAEA